jgi:hypothetical protein
MDWINVSSSLNDLLSSSFTNRIQRKKDDDSEYDSTSTMMYSDDSASSNSGNGNGNLNGNGNTHSQKSTSTNFYDRLDDQEVVSPISVMEVATIGLDEHGTGSPPLPRIENFHIHGDDDDSEIRHGTSFTKGNPKSQSSASRRLKVSTLRLTETSKLKSE